MKYDSCLLIQYACVHLTSKYTSLDDLMGY